MSGAWFPPDITLGVQDKEVNLVLSKTEQKKTKKFDKGSIVLTNLEASICNKSVLLFNS